MLFWWRWSTMIVPMETRLLVHSQLGVGRLLRVQKHCLFCHHTKTSHPWSDSGPGSGLGSEGPWRPHLGLLARKAKAWERSQKDLSRRSVSPSFESPHSAAALYCLLTAFGVENRTFWRFSCCQGSANITATATLDLWSKALLIFNKCKQKQQAICVDLWCCSCLWVEREGEGEKKMEISEGKREKAIFFNF